MSISITLTRTAQQEVLNNGALANYAFMVVASGGVNVPNEIFKVNQSPLDPLTGSTTVDFLGVCSPFDIQSLPIDAPVPPGTQYRVALITVTYQTTNDGNNAWTDIQNDVQYLLNSLAANNQLVVEDIVNLTNN